MDYGSLLCWATNSIGRQDVPCIFHLIPAGKPDAVHNCTVRNQTASSLDVRCGKGFHGGLPQAFMMEVIDATTHFLVANTTNANGPVFTVTGLRPGSGYIVSVYAFNSKGRGKAMRIHAFTLKKPAAEMIDSSEQMVDNNAPKTGESSLTRMGEFQVSCKGVNLYELTKVFNVNSTGTRSPQSWPSC